MFDKLRGTMEQLKALQQMLKDPNVKALIENPKMQAVMKHPAFQAAVKAKNMQQIAFHLAPLARDPDVGPLLAKVNPATFMPSSAA